MLGDSESSEWKTANGVPLAVTASLGGSPLFNAEFKTYGGVPASYNGRFTEKPIIDLTRDTLLPLRIERTGPGRLYYTASLRYGISIELASARDEGLGVSVETFDADGNAVRNGRLQAGKTYIRRVTVSSSRDLTFVALRSPIPSGAEYSRCHFCYQFLRFRAVMPGIYPTPPAAAECMYEEEIFGRSRGNWYALN